MAGRKRNRRRTGREARLAAAAAARKRAQRRRLATFAGIGAVVVAAVVAVVVLAGGDDGTTDLATTNTTISPTTTDTGRSAGESAEGKPCVAVSEPLPAGAPAVPVKEGPPPTELVKEDLKPGDGAPVAPNDTVTVNYIGVSCSTGKVFDSSYSRNAPATFPLNQVIKGWQEGIAGMSVGGQRLLGIPPALAYGPAGRPPTIAPEETLWFVVEVVDAKPA